MIIIDRVFCDVCRCVMGQLMAQPAQARDLISFIRPIVCPDCRVFPLEHIA